MKPTETQKTVCEALIEQLQFWKHTNDIDSPTHYTDMDEHFTLLSDCLSETEIEELTSETCNLFQFIKNLAV